MSSGNFALNLPIFDMYLNDLPAIESWTKRADGRQAGRVRAGDHAVQRQRLLQRRRHHLRRLVRDRLQPDFNAETITSGAEIGLWIWQQYQDTGSLCFLQKYYPIMEQAATFLLAWQSAGSDGYLHAVANAHETQWAVQDPTTDIAADQALFPAVISAATLLGTDSALASQLRTALGQIEPYPRTSQRTVPAAEPAAHLGVRRRERRRQGNDVIADSYQPSAANHNQENIGLEPVWPYGVIGDSTIVNGDNLTALADRTYNSRPYPNQPRLDI